MEQVIIEMLIVAFPILNYSTLQFTCRYTILWYLHTYADSKAYLIGRHNIHLVKYLLKILIGTYAGS